MALTRTELQELGLTEAQVEGVMSAQDAQAAEAADWEAKYRQAVEALRRYREAVNERERIERLEAAYRALLAQAGVDPKRFDVILRVTPLDALRLSADGHLEDEAALLERIREEWADFIVTEERRGARVATPPAGAARRMTREEILAIPDTAARQQAIAENHELFGF